MFESLSTRLQGTIRSLRGEARLTEATVEAAPENPDQIGLELAEEILSHGGDALIR